MNFASPSVQTTSGLRGRTTARRSTRTVRGDEGAAIAEMKEELMAREPWTAYQLTFASSVYGHQSDVTRNRSLETVRADLEAKIVRNAKYPHAGRFTITEVRVRFSWIGQAPREEVIETIREVESVTV